MKNIIAVVASSSSATNEPTNLGLMLNTIETHCENCASALRWFIDNPETTWSGTGPWLLGVLAALFWLSIKAIKWILKKRSISAILRAEDNLDNEQRNETEKTESRQIHFGSGDNVGRDKIDKRERG